MTAETLPEIPLYDIGTRGAHGLIKLDRSRAEGLLDGARRRYGRMAMWAGDGASRAWLRRNASPYREEIEAVGASLAAAGAVMLNCSYEWGCTSLVEPDPVGDGARMLRVLDWRLPGLGRHVVVARATSPAGEYYDVTWPGAVGVLTAMAPGRFAAAIHQAPMRQHGMTLVGDWARNRALLWRRTSLPPSHLLRRVFETCGDYAAARRALIDTEIALPAIFLLSGATPDDTCVIERLEDRAFVHDGPGALANDWRAARSFAPGSWRPRGRENRGRAACLTAFAGRDLRRFEWLTPPVLNRDTRLAVRMNASRAELAVLGIEAEAPATKEFTLSHRALAAA